MTSGFQQQQSHANFGFLRTEPRPQQVGRRLEPTEREAEVPAPRPIEARAFSVVRG